MSLGFFIYIPKTTKKIWVAPERTTQHKLYYYETLYSLIRGKTGASYCVTTGGACG